MRDFDLVPADHRRRRRTRRALWQLVAAEVAVLVLAGAAKGAVSIDIGAHERSVARLEAERHASANTMARAALLREEIGRLEAEAAVLDQLRTGPPATAVLGDVERALVDGVWFERWKFMRAGEFVAPRPQSVQTGYIAVIPEPAANDDEKGTWRVGTHMEIHGRSLDHAALARFVEQLGREPQVAEVKVLRTRSVRYTERRVVEFDLAVVMGGRG